MTFKIESLDLTSANCFVWYLEKRKLVFKLTIIAWLTQIRYCTSLWNVFKISQHTEFVFRNGTRVDRPARALSENQ